MKAFFKIIFLLVSSSIILTSCSSDDNNSSNPVLIKKLHAEVLGNVSDYNFNYNGTKLNTISYSVYDGTTTNGILKFEYTNDLITKITETNNLNVVLFETTFDYNSTILVKVIKENFLNTTAEKTLFTYNVDGTVLAERFIGTNVNQTQLVDSEKMVFNNNKLVQKDVISSNAIMLTYEYDNANHPLKNITGISDINVYMNYSYSIFSSNGVEGIENNRIKQTYLSGGVATDELNFQTEYNSNNYPISKIGTIDSPGNYEYLYTYF